MNYMLSEDDQVVDISTGEVIQVNDIKQLMTNSQDKYVSNVNGELISLGLEPKYKLIKYKSIDYNCVVVKEKYTFNKTFRVELRCVMNNNLSLGSLAFIARFEPYISFPSNTIVIDSRHPSLDDYKDKLKVGRNKIYEILKELEYYDVIKRVKLNGEYIIYFNPFLYASGFVTEKSTYDLFKISTYNPLNQVIKE